MRYQLHMTNGDIVEFEASSVTEGSGGGLIVWDDECRFAGTIFNRDQWVYVTRMDIPPLVMTKTGTVNGEQDAQAEAWNSPEANYRVYLETNKSR